MILSNPVGWVRDGDTDNNIKDRMNEGIEDILSRWLATVVCTSGYGEDSIRTEHLQEVKVNARQHRRLTSTSPLQLLDKGIC